MKLPVYMDNHAATPLDPRVLEAMLPYFTEHFANPASLHADGRIADDAVRIARGEVATLIGCAPEEIIFTSGATESDNLAVKGAAWGQSDRGRHIIVSSLEHSAVLGAARRLVGEGFDLTLLPVDPSGSVDPEDVRRAIRDDTVLVSVITASNEIGTIQPIAEIAAICREVGVLVHTDAAQAAGKIPEDVDSLGVDLMSVSAHKMYGPKGVGALYVRRRRPRVRLLPLIDGGGQERDLRSGTLNVPGIVGFGAACKLAAASMPDETARVTALRDRLQERITAAVDDVKVNGHPERRLPGNLSISFSGVEGEALLNDLTNVAVSSGAACSSENTEPSHVLKAIGLDDQAAKATLRFGLGRFNTGEEVDWVAGQVAEAVQRLRMLAVPLPG